jgi:hypothetical protein
MEGDESSRDNFWWSIVMTPFQSELLVAGNWRIRGRLVLTQCDVPQGSQMMAGIASWEPPEPCKLPRTVWTLDRQSKTGIRGWGHWGGGWLRGSEVPWQCGCCASPMSHWKVSPEVQYRDVVSEESTVPAGLTSRTVSDHRPRVII